MAPLAPIKYTEVPVVFHEKYVERGFRPVNQPWKNYFLSLFQWHNEVMNVWTHLIGFFMVIFRTATWWTEFPLLTDPYMWPLTVGIITMLILYACSSGAHCLHSRSEVAHYVCFMVDYAGIGLYGFGSAMVHYWYCLHEDFMGSLSHQLGIPIAALIGVICCVCCSVSKTKYSRPYPLMRRVWQMVPVFSMYIWQMLPIWYKLGYYLYDGVWESSFSHHIQQMLWFFTGGFFFGSDIPQRMFPGRFDFIGHSHQLFHICIMFTTLKQIDALYTELTDGSEFIRRMEAPTFLGTWGALGFVIIANTFVVLAFYRSICLKMVTDGETKKSNGHCQEDEYCNGVSQDLSDGSLNTSNGIHSDSMKDGLDGLRHRTETSSSRTGVDNEIAVTE